jgi:hypothetical protein
MCQLVPVSRRSFYRSLKEQRPDEEETEVRSVIQQIALEHRRRYGYRRITAELRRRGMQVNHKRVVRIMRKDNLLALQPKCFKVTTNSNHKFEIYLNLAARMKLAGINQLWVADITYIRLKVEFTNMPIRAQSPKSQGGSPLRLLRIPGSASSGTRSLEVVAMCGLLLRRTRRSNLTGWNGPRRC